MIGNKYRLGERIGAGGMAEVFRADLVGTRGFERSVALKRVLPQRSENPDFARMFVNEARIMAALRHPNVVTVLDFTRDEEQRLCLVMELVEGVTLRRVVRAGPVPLAIAIHIATELLRGLGYVHDHRDASGTPRGLVHRDLSANNVFLTWDGAVKLGDFGIARAYAAGDADDADGYGTPHYMSPEQVKGTSLDRRSDLFAVGVLLYELVTGTRPFTAESSTQLDLAVLNQPITPPRELRQDIPADLEALILQLLERERAQRPASAKVVIEALERCPAASHRGRTQLMALLCERFPSSAPGAGPAPEPRRITDRSADRNQDPPALWVNVEANKGVRQPAGQAAAQAPAPSRLQAQPPGPPGSFSRRPTAIKRTGTRWAPAAALLLVLAIGTGWLLLRNGSAPIEQAGNQAMNERQTEEHAAHHGMPALDEHEAEDSVQPLPAGPRTLATGARGVTHVPGDIPVEMF